MLFVPELAVFSSPASVSFDTEVEAPTEAEEALDVLDEADEALFEVLACADMLAEALVLVSLLEHCVAHTTTIITNTMASTTHSAITAFLFGVFIARFPSFERAVSFFLQYKLPPLLPPKRTQKQAAQS